ncbi:MAG: hypothetical protein ABUL60_16735 [Myxococcales bacterium]
MGFFSNLFGIGDTSPRQSPRDVVAGMGRSALPENDAQAVERYRYMLRTAPPDTLEQAHAEAFSKLTPEQRAQVLGQLAEEAPAAERAAVAATAVDDPQALARVATRAELRNPGTVERTLAGSGGMGLGASLLSSFAMGFAGSMVAQSVFSALAGFGGHDDASADEDDSQETAQADDENGGDVDDGGFDGGDFDV